MAPKMSTSQDIHLEMNKIPWRSASSTTKQDRCSLEPSLCYGGKGGGVHCFATMSDPFVLQAEDLGKGPRPHSGLRHPT